MSLERLLTVAEAADLLALPKARVYELIREQRFPAIRIGVRQLRINPKAVEAFISSGGAELPPP